VRFLYTYARRTARGGRKAAVTVERSDDERTAVRSSSEWE
jgi:hypothetical protein